MVDADCITVRRTRVAAVLGRELVVGRDEIVLNDALPIRTDDAVDGFFTGNP
jgi:hypothetical protein